MIKLYFTHHKWSYRLQWLVRLPLRNEKCWMVFQQFFFKLVNKLIIIIAHIITWKGMNTWDSIQKTVPHMINLVHTLRTIFKINYTKKIPTATFSESKNWNKWTTVHLLTNKIGLTMLHRAQQTNLVQWRCLVQEKILKMVPGW